MVLADVWGGARGVYGSWNRLERVQFDSVREQDVWGKEREVDGEGEWRMNTGWLRM